MIGRRSLLTSLLFAPAIIRTPGLLMPVKPIVRLRTVEQIMSHMISLVVSDMMPVIIDAMTHGAPGGVLTRLDDTGNVVVKFIPGTEIYLEFYG